MDAVYRVVNAVGRGVLRAMSVDVRWSGVEQVPRSGPVVLAATHGSYPDFVFVEKALVTRGRYVRFMCRHDVWGVPVVPWFMDAMGHVPVDRRVPAYSYLRARRLLEDGEAVCSFPEAGLSHSFTVRALMRGTVALARATGAPLVPVALWGNQRTYSVGDPAPPLELVRGARVDIAFGTPARVGPGEDLVARTQRLGQELTGLLEGLQELPHHRPRPGEVAPWHPAHLGGHAPDRRRALELDELPVGAVLPTWGPDLEVYARLGDDPAHERNL